MLQVKIHQCLGSIPMSKFDKFDTPSVTDFYGILPASPAFPPKIVSWYIRRATPSISLPPFELISSHYSTMPMQSRILAPPFASPLDIVPFNPISNSSVLCGILESSFLTMTLKRHHIHASSEIHNFHSLDFDLANGIWRVLKDLITIRHLGRNGKCCLPEMST
jgi:hypothetical protein